MIVMLLQSGQAQVCPECNKMMRSKCRMGSHKVSSKLKVRELFYAFSD